MNFPRLPLSLVAPLALTGCLSINLDHVVRDTADVGKSAYQSISEKMDAKKKPKAAASVISHSYIGKPEQSVADVKQICETEAAQKLRALVGANDAPYTVVENEIVVINGGVAANCKVGMDKKPNAS